MIKKPNACLKNTLSTSLVKLRETLTINPRSGDNYGNNIYKIRLEGEGKGKSGGYRVITYLVEKDKTTTNIYLITIFTKAEENTITKAEAIKIIKKIFM